MLKWEMINRGTIVLVILFVAPAIKTYLERRIASKPRRWAGILKVVYWPVLLIPLIIGIAENYQEKQIRRGSNWASQGHEHLHAGLDAKSSARIELGIFPLKKAIEILQEFPSEYNGEIQARHDLALALERIAYDDFNHGCIYQLKNNRITTRYEEGGSNIATSPNLAEVICTDFNFAKPEMWDEAKKEYNDLYNKLSNRDINPRKDIGSEFLAAARSTAYFYICDNLRVGGSALDNAQIALEMVSKATSRTEDKRGLPIRNKDAEEKLRFLKTLVSVTETDKELWDPNCRPQARGVAMPQGTAIAIPEEVRKEMKGSSWHANLQCPDFDALVLLRIPYWGFDHKSHWGEMIVAKDVADDVLKVFQQLYKEEFPIERMVRVDAYGGDDNASMAENNTSAFNCRLLTDGSSLSEHSYGTAIDINPKQNPYVKGSTVLPLDGKDYLDRGKIRPGMAEQKSIKAAFESIDWKWGGDWESLKDYQHFSKSGK